MREESLFAEALAIADASERAAFLGRACGDDAELRREVESLLAAHDASNVLDRPAVAAGQTGPHLPASPRQECAGRVIDKYKLVEQIGEGGMGAVWMAQQTEPVKRLVAVKLIKAGMDSKQVVARFEAERQALALMDHPNIARVLDAGATEAGQPYFVMELVKGVPITRYCDEHHLTPRQRVELFLPVCQAIQHAHQKGVIHRDIKPSNVLVALYDGRPVPKVIDFGVAKAAGQPLTDKTLVTGFGAIVGTLEYMSPEQAETNQLDIDTRSDVYSLGVLLYELLTGSPPFSRKELGKAGILEMLRVIREQEPTKPSTKLSSSDALPTLSANRGTEPAKLTRLVRGELDWIVMKALEKDRNRRYESANGFAMDIQRYLADEAVLACPPSVGYRFRKFARRNKGGLAVAALVLLILVVVGSGVGWAVRDRAARQSRVGAQVDLILGEVDRLEREQKWPEALAAARRAEAAGGEADSATAERVHQQLKGLEFIDRLDQIRMSSAAWVDGKFDNARADREYAQTFRDYGVDVQELAEETSIDRLKARSSLALPLGSALDHWISARLNMGEQDAAGRRRLVAVARGIDPNPLRDRLRSTWGQPVSSELRDELRRIAQSINIRTQSPATLAFLASTLQQVEDSDTAVRVLRDAQNVYRGDFWLNLDLGSALRMRMDFEGAARYYAAAVAIRPTSTAAIYNLGSALLDQKRLDEAVAAYRTAIDLDPKDAQAQIGLGIALRGQKRLDEAIAAYRTAIELDPKLAQAHIGLGIALRGQKRLDEAIAAYRTAIELDPKDAYVHFNLGNALSDQKKLDEAVAAYRTALDLDPKLTVVHYNLGNALYGLKRLDESAAAYHKALEFDPKHADVHYSLGNALYSQRKLDKAVAAYRQAVELDPKHANAHFTLGNALSEQKKPDEAVPAYRAALDLDPKLPNGYYNLGIALRNLKRLDEAVAAFRKAIETDPKSAPAHINLGIALRGQKMLDEAVAAFRKAIELDPKSALAYANLGNVLSEQKRPDEAVAAYRKAIDLDPRFAAGVHTQIKQMSRGKEFDALRAREDFKKLVADVEAKRPLNDRAWDLAMDPDPSLRDPKRAVELAEKAVAELPKDATCWNTLGVARYRAGDSKEAVAALMKYRELRPDDAEGTNPYFLAMAHWKLGDKDEAARWYKLGVEWMERKKADTETMRQVRAEAAELLAVEKKKD